MYNDGVEAGDLLAAWNEQDWIASSRKCVERVLSDHAANGHQTLTNLMTPRVAFGTAGLRAEMLPGFSMINHVTVRQACLGLADYLLAQSGPDSREAGIVLGHDHRAMTTSTICSRLGIKTQGTLEPDYCNSKSFTKLAAATLESKGFQIRWLGQCHTPLVPFAVKNLQATAGIMVGLPVH